jgi:hypothetical protein
MNNAELQYNIDIESASKKADYQYVSEYYRSMVKNYYALYQLVADSKFRNYFYGNMTDDQIKSVVDRTNTYDDNLVQLENQSNDILLQFYNIQSSAGTNPSLPELYSEYVQVNNKIAQAYGYDNYMEYAYKEIYGRDYSYTEIHQAAEYMKEYLAPTVSKYIKAFQNYTASLEQEEYFKYYKVLLYSFFEDTVSNTTVNNFFDLISGSDYGTLNFAQLLEDLMTDGNYYLGTYNGAYTSLMSSIDSPILLYGENYRDSFDVVHEFGHYTNMCTNLELYNSNELTLSFDLAETHSQGLEMLYLSYLGTEFSSEAYTAIVLYKLANYEANILKFMAVNLFEEAVYTNQYEGTGSDTIMADGEITSDEYDYLFCYILYDLGLGDYIGSFGSYWRYVTISQPCYYASYSISLLASLQLYVKAENESLADAVAAYEKIITYALDDTTTTTGSDVNGNEVDSDDVVVDNNGNVDGGDNSCNVDGGNDAVGNDGGVTNSDSVDGSSNVDSESGSDNSSDNGSDSNASMTYSQILKYAGLYDYNDERLYIELSNLFTVD